MKALEKLKYYINDVVFEKFYYRYHESIVLYFNSTAVKVELEWVNKLCFLNFYNKINFFFKKICVKSF